MASIAAKSKKGTVIHRTTSETLRLGEDALRGTPIPRKKSQVTSPSCSFQITGVLTRYDMEDESADDLDESHTDEISRVTDNETPSFSEDSKDDQQVPNIPSTQPVQNQNLSNANLAVPSAEKHVPIITSEKVEKTKSNINTDLGRFRVVKLASMVPFSRGRWTCYDYLDESAEGKATLNISTSVTSISCWSTASQPSYLYTGSILMPEDIPIFVPLSTNHLGPYSSENNLPKTRHASFTSYNSMETVINNSNLDSNQNKQIFPTVAQNDNLVGTNNDLASSNDNSCVPSSTTIDTKIEHALDVVKNHLTLAVRLEVEELKIKINELVERISHLEYENDLLRANVTPEVLATLGNIRKH
ncbi:protein bunched, class 2/F/G isoform-like [Sitophilus oryzae]|uniref:Protein bunched, class 2/F/G isoform-like n=1 Tax=Sitophilus oryzae TaxID=7048 RepID=A0A6J2XAP1_SITOR|nr:protein bunched, class 2/F/G isoform-like [Sitophilus oryzae]